MKAEGTTTSADPESVAAPTVPPAIDTAELVSATEHGGDQETLIEGSTHSREDTLHSGGPSDSQVVASNSQPSEGQHTPESLKEAGDLKKKPAAPTGKPEDKTENFVGKLSNLVTTDTGNIVDARDFIIVILQVPVQLILCVSYLYTILGWRYPSHMLISCKI